MPSARRERPRVARKTAAADSALIGAPQGAVAHMKIKKKVVKKVPRATQGKEIQAVCKGPLQAKAGDLHATASQQTTSGKKKTDKVCRKVKTIKKSEVASKVEPPQVAGAAEVPKIGGEERKAKVAAPQKTAKQTITDESQWMSNAPEAQRILEAKKLLAEVKARKEKRKAALSNAETAETKKRLCNDGSKIATKVIGSVEFRKLHEIVVDRACPAPFETFDAAAPALGASLAKALVAQGYSSPSPIQAQSWPVVLTGQDVVAVAKTGSGKTCGYLLPALARIGERGPAPTPKRLSYHSVEPARPSVLVMAPTRELALQIAGEAEKFATTIKARVVTLYGGASKGPQVGACRAGCDILIATPGRLTDLCAGDTKRGLEAPVSLANVTYLVLDEADQMLDMGFEPAIRKIVAMCPATGTPEEGGGASGSRAGTKRQTLFFTATWPKKVQSAASDLTSKGAMQIRIGQGSGGDKLTLNKNVVQEIRVTERNQKTSVLKQYLSTKLGAKENALVFAGTKGGCDYLEREINGSCQGLWCRAIHGDKEQWEREEILGEFRAKVAAGRQAVLVATDVASRGLDIPGISLVIVYDFSGIRQAPGMAIESFVHRVGRTGRAGAKGRALTLWTSEDKGAPAFIKLLEGAGQKVPRELIEMASWEKPQRNARGNSHAPGWGTDRSWADKRSSW